MKEAAAILVILTSHGCKIENIDTSDVTHFPVSTVAECEEKAAAIDENIGVRAFCIPSNQ